MSGATISSTSATSNLSPLEQMIAGYKLIDAEPSLLTELTEYLGVKIKDYRDPTKTELNFTSKLLDGLIAEDPLLITEAVTKLKLVGLRVKQDPNLVIYRCPNISAFPVILYWRFGDDVAPLFIEDPHNKSDLIFRVATDMILNPYFKARGMISNSASKGCGDPKKVGKAPGQDKRNRADGAHSTATLFFAIGQMLARKQGAEVAHLQLHGMIGSSNTFMLVENGYSINYTSKYRSFPTEFAYALAEEYPMEACNKFVLCTQKLPGQKDNKPYTMNNFQQDKAWFRTKSKPINTWVGPRGPNGGGTWRLGKEDRGLWLGIELRTDKFGMQNDQQQRNTLMRVVARAVENFHSSTKPRPIIIGAADDAFASASSDEQVELIYPSDDLENLASSDEAENNSDTDEVEIVNNQPALFLPSRQTRSKRSRQNTAKPSTSPKTSTTAKRPKHIV